jgi:cyanate lyase
MASLTSKRPLDIAHLWNSEVSEQDRKGLTFKDLQDNFGDDCVTVVYKAYRTTLQRELKGVERRINSGELQLGDAGNLAELAACVIWLNRWAPASCGECVFA